MALVLVPEGRCHVTATPQYARTPAPIRWISGAPVHELDPMPRDSSTQYRAPAPPGPVPLRARRMHTGSEDRPDYPVDPRGAGSAVNKPSGLDETVEAISSRMRELD